MRKGFLEFGIKKQIMFSLQPLLTSDFLASSNEVPKMPSAAELSFPKNLGTKSLVRALLASPAS